MNKVVKNAEEEMKVIEKEDTYKSGEEEDNMNSALIKEQIDKQREIV
jgi:hypothetical protein